MEIHQPPQPAHRSKPFKEYLLEGLMIFVAVTMGFFAESFREHLNDREKEKQYMMTMLEDMRDDSAQNKEIQRQWGARIKQMDSVAEAIVIPLSTADLPDVYRHINAALDWVSFYYNDRTITQLKSSGAFRLIHNSRIAKEIIAYDQLNNNEIKNIYYQFNKFYENTVQLRNKAFSQVVINQIFDRYDLSLSSLPLPPPSADPWIDSLIKVNTSPFSPKDQEAFLFEFKNALLAYRENFYNMKWGMGNCKNTKMN
jgi:hypothetical protein